ncbi:hypothetical protein Tco_1134368 [Tanacetum coccineum]
MQDITCWNYNRKGHFQNQFLKPIASKDKEVNMAVRDYDDALVCCVQNTIEDRIMDSSASFHATFCKEELDYLKDVRYIPGIKRRLKSVGQLDEEGYHVGFGDKKWKVSHPAKAEMRSVTRMDIITTQWCHNRENYMN